ncbi:fungal-specific transcription factor domain-containing protein [Annulohypoxylon moriforme]|nr:fungal-specific transcription factor domain-containing protein [Annulohypoxylon moriforme]
MVAPESTKRRASKACSSCSRRKVRCDVLAAGIPCTNCRSSSFECSVKERKKRRGKDDPGYPGALGISLRRSIPEHAVLHQCLHARDRERGILRPVIGRDPSASSKTFEADGDLRYLESKGVFDLPARDVLENCLTTYFYVFHPFFPVIDKPSFMNCFHYSNQDAIIRGEGTSLLLLQAILFIASSYVSSELIQSMGFSSRKQARSSLYERARCLHTFDYETDDIATIQALLLISHYYPSVMEQRHTWHWVYQAIGLAQGAGLHRELHNESPQRQLWARVGWCCLIRDRLIALGTARPMHINSLDCSVPLLELSDLVEDGDSDDELTTKSIFIEFIKLCRYMEGVLSLSSAATPTTPEEQVALCESTLYHWLLNLHPTAKREHTSRENSEESISTVYRALLHLIYNIVLIRLRHFGSTLEETCANSPRAPSLETQSVSADSVELMSDLMTMNLVRLCPTQSVTTVIPPLIIQISSMRFQRDTGDCSAIMRFQTCMEFLKQLGENYWHANFYREYFDLVAINSHVSQLRDHKTPYREKQGLGSDHSRRGMKATKQDIPTMNEESSQDTRLSYPHPTSTSPVNPPFMGPMDLTLGPSLLPADTSTQGLNNQLFEDLLNDYDLFQSLFSST